MDRKDWIRDVLVNKILESYTPWKGAELVKSEIEYIEGMKNNFASITYSVVVHLKKTKDGTVENESHPIFLKFIVDNPVMRKTLHSEKQFFNEIVWYTKVVPKFQWLIDESKNRSRPLSMFPKCYYTHYDDSDAVVALEDLRPRNFVLGDRIALSVNYVEKALEALACSHALAYRWRETNEENFLEVATSFKEITTVEEMESVFKIVNERVLKSLGKDPKYAKQVQKFCEITATPAKLIQTLVHPEGPLATICHGDFCRNNILFSERSVNEELVFESMLIDFQTVLYASPAIDLSFFFFMSTSPELRATEFDRLFNLYYDTVMNELKNLTGPEETDIIVKRNKIFTLQAFKDDFAFHALYGYFVTSCFLPMMMIGDEELEEIMHLWVSEDPAYDASFVTLGGELVTLRLVKTLKEILDRGYLPIKEN